MPMGCLIIDYLVGVSFKKQYLHYYPIMTNFQDNKRIAKNTLLLYFRMFFTILVGLYTSRIVLAVLDREDYGIYNVVGGVVAMFGFLNSAMIATSQRFIAYELGRGTWERLQKVFSMSINIHFLIAAVVLLLSETIGVWFLNVKMNIPVHRLNAANWVYQCSIFALVINIIGVPYNAAIVAHEKMKVYAYICILEVSLKLLIAFLLSTLLFGDKLKLYAVLILLSAFIIRIVYVTYCKYRISGCHYSMYWNKLLFMRMMGFAGWSFVGNLGFVAKDQGVNILLNLFEGPVVNAARGIAYQVSGVVQGFVQNFQMAMNPQITKLYASGERQAMLSLVFRGSRFSFYLLLMVVIPVLLNTSYILKLWLTVVPENTDMFLRLVLIMSLIHSMAGSLVTAIQATGRIKKFQICIALVMLMDIPLSYCLLKFGYASYSVMYIAIFTTIIGLFVRLWILKQSLSISLTAYMKQVVLKNLLIFILSFFIPFYCCSDATNFGELVLYTLGLLIYVASIIFFTGLQKNERKFLSERILKHIYPMKYGK